VAGVFQGKSKKETAADGSSVEHRDNKAAVKGWFSFVPSALLISKRPRNPMPQIGEKKGRSITSDDPGLLMSFCWRLVGVGIVMHALLARFG
jgi:hypothetical protein